jgi:hypothetical protein
MRVLARQNSEGRLKRWLTQERFAEKSGFSQ